MKIDPNLVIGNMVNAKPGSTPSATAGVFEDMLQGIEKRQVNTSMPVQGASPIELIAPHQLGALTVSEQALEMLEEYMNALSDPQCSLKSVASMLDDLGAMKARIGQAGHAVGAHDPLSSIMKELVSTIESEEVRFGRGDMLG
ncbi:MAG: hypothetical protein JW920_00125 [Deltaproteobacteria bacterium]|nr:hypothetical protein [Deltaproteobacteria bacterium]